MAAYGMKSYDVVGQKLDGHYEGLDTLPAADYPCHCVSDHNPEPVRTQKHHIFPVGWGGDRKGEVVAMCGSGHDNVHVLLDVYKRIGGRPDWEVRRNYGPYIRALAEEGWQRWLAAQEEE